MKTAYIGIGSNLGNKLDNCLQAIALADEIPGCEVKSKSPFYRTAPVGVQGQDWYLNGAISLTADITAKELLKSLLAIETRMGRQRKEKWGPRPIDLDILLFGKDIIDEKDLTVPHPMMHLRKFVLTPLVQLAPDLVHPVLGLTIAELLDGFSGEGQTVIALGEM